MITFILAMENTAERSLVVRMLVIPVLTIYSIVVGYGTALLHPGPDETTLCETYVWITVLAGWCTVIGCLFAVVHPDVLMLGLKDKTHNSTRVVMLTIGFIINYGGVPCATTSCSTYVLITWWLNLFIIPILLILFWVTTGIVTCVAVSVSRCVVMK